MSQKKKDLLIGIVRKYMQIGGCDSYKQLAGLLGMNLRTFMRRIADPELFTMGEINRIKRFLKIPSEELSEVWG